MKKYALLMGLGLLVASATAQTILPSDLFGRNVNQFGLGSVWPANVSMASPGAEMPAAAASGISLTLDHSTPAKGAAGHPSTPSGQDKELRYSLLCTSLDWLTIDSGIRTLEAPSKSLIRPSRDIFQFLADVTFGKNFGAPAQSLSLVIGSADAPAVASLTAPLDFKRLGFEQPGFEQFNWPGEATLPRGNQNSPVAGSADAPAVASLTAPLDFTRLGFEQPGFDQFNWPGEATLPRRNQISPVAGSADAPAIASLSAPLDFTRLGFEQPGFDQFNWPGKAALTRGNQISPVAGSADAPAVASLTAPLDFTRLGFEQPGFEQFNWPGEATLPRGNQISEVASSPGSKPVANIVAAAGVPQDFPQTLPSTSLFSPLALVEERFASRGQGAEAADGASILSASALLPPTRVEHFALANNRDGESRVAMEAPAELHLSLSTSSEAHAISQQEPSQTQSVQPPDQPSPPTNPLQTAEPPKPTDTNTTNAKSTFSGGESTNEGKDQILGELRLMQRYSQINGDQTRSFRVPGSNRLAEFNIFTDNAFRFSRRIQSLFMYRGTDDRSIDPEHNSLQKAYVRFYGPRDETILGDSLVNYSRLTFNQNIKGLNFSTRLGEHWKVFAVGGIFIDRYGSLYNDLPGRPYRAAVAGARLEYRFLKESTLGFNFSNSTDQIGSLPLQSAPGNPTGVGIPPLPADNRVYSVDSKFQLGALRTDVELAYSQTDFDRRFFAGCPGTCDSRGPLPGFGFQNDFGFRLDESYRHKKLNLRGSYVRYEPNFASINARQIADLQDIVFRAGYDVTDWLSVDGTVRRSNNDLKQQLPFETTLWGPEARFLFHDLSIYRRATLEVGYRHRDVQASDKSIDRFVRIPYVEFSVPVSTTFLTIGYERRNSVDMRDASQSSNTDRVYASLRGIYDLGGWHITPSFRYELERQSHRPRINSFPVANCFLTPFNVNCLLDRDSNRLGLASVFVEPPKYFIAELSFRDTSATLFGPAGYSRPSYRAQLTYKIRNDENTEFIMGFERNSNFYFTSPDYDERIFSGTLLFKFAKRGQ